MFEVKKFIVNLDSRKISIAKQVLSLNNDKVLTVFENLLKEIKLSDYESTLKPITLKQYKDEIRRAIQDEKGRRIIRSADLKKQVNEWS